MSLNEDKSLQLLRQILLTENDRTQEELRVSLEELRFKLTDKETKIEEYYPIITDLLSKKINDSEEEVARVLSPIIGKSIKKQINYSREDVIDALYPIMGQLVKKSVSESLKDLYNSINQRIDDALKNGIFSKRIKSKISGVSASDLIMKESFPFMVKEVFLIHEESGILISHISAHSQSKSLDGDIISGMLTAIKDFVSESFRTESGSESLYEIQYGDSRIVLERSRYAYLAVVIAGREPVDFHEKLSKLSMNIHKKYIKNLKSFDGDLTGFNRVDQIIQRFINSFVLFHSESSEIKARPVLLYLFLSLLGLLLIIFALIKIPEYFRNKEINDIIKSNLELVPDNFIKNIDWEINDNSISLSGFVSSIRQKILIDSLFNSIPNIDSVENEINILVPSFNIDKSLAEVRQRLKSFGNESITCQIIGDQLILEGNVNSDEKKRNISYEISKVPGVFFIINNIEVNKASNFSDNESVELIEKMKLYYRFGRAEVTEYHREQLDSIVPFIRRTPKIILKISGFSDDLGSPATRKQVAKQRADRVANYLISQGILPEQVEVLYESSNNDLNIKPDLQRRVEFNLISLN